MFFWGLGVELVNAYKMYRIYNLNMGISEKKLLSHFEFQKEIAINYITSGVKKPPPAISTAPRKRNRESAPRASFSETDASAGSRRSARLYEPPQKKKKSERCTDASLSVNGSLKCRLNTDLRHFPYPPNTKSHTVNYIDGRVRRIKANHEGTFCSAWIATCTCAVNALLCSTQRRTW